MTPCHFGKFETWVPESNWYSEDGEEMWTGGYYRKTKSLKVPNMRDELHIADDFQPVIREQGSTKNWTIPNAKLWIDSLQK